MKITNEKTASFQSLFCWKSVWEFVQRKYPAKGEGFNPCFVGNRSGRSVKPIAHSFGFMFQSLFCWKSVWELLMGKSTCRCRWVSILVLLEIGLGVLRINILQNCQSSFNPCFVGNRSGSVFDVLNSIYFAYVSILVLLEIGLGVALIIWFCCDMLRFNPCFVGNRSGSRHLTNT